MNGKTIATIIIVAILALGTAGAVFYSDYARAQQGLASSQPQQQEEESPSQEDPEQQQAQEKAQEEAQRQELVAAFAAEKQDFYLLLANIDNQLPQDFTVETQEIQNGFVLDERIAQPTLQMIEDAKADGVDLMLCSAYRSMEKQTALFNEMLNDYLAQGKTQEEAYALTSNAIAVPGTSEHQTGLAADIVTPTHQNLDPQFADTPAGQWLNENAWKYGFILRYPQDKEDITKIMYESWHFRYVGPFHALLMKQSGLCLEEYLAQELPEGYTNDPQVIQVMLQEAGGDVLPVSSQPQPSGQQGDSQPAPSAQDTAQQDDPLSEDLDLVEEPVEGANPAN